MGIERYEEAIISKGIAATSHEHGRLKDVPWV